MPFTQRHAHNAHNAIHPMPHFLPKTNPTTYINNNNATTTTAPCGCWMLWFDTANKNLPTTPKTYL
jgi:hypothetical protein